MNSPLDHACLYIVATPIGNLGDMVPRAVEVLQSVDLIAAEDTRHSKRLMQHFNIDTRMVSYHDHSGQSTVDGLLDKLQSGKAIALISDAGTPLISDPGYRLVDAALAAGIKVVPVPGASAAIAALSASGLPSDRFVFEGFLSHKSGARRKQLALVAGDTRTLIFYEAPHRLLETLDDMIDVLGHERLAVLARELTKTYETIRRDSLQSLREWVESDPDQQKGECVLLVHGNVSDEKVIDEGKRVFDILAAELPLKQAAALAASISGAKKNTLYQYGLEQKGPNPE